ncbi:MAG TPA: HAMP domain-containing sensor histidine kinase [Thermomicrobiales bacterium]|nr:HAMP domain-containing sensor histidine kinase [Thermomicrobiales bacterium]
MASVLRDAPLRWRLTAFYIAILSAILVLLGVLLYVQLDRYLVDDAVARVRAGAAPTIARYLDPRRTPPKNLPANATPAERLAFDAKRMAADLSTSDVVAVLTDTDGNVLATGDGQGDQPTPPTLDRAQVDRALAGEMAPFRTVHLHGEHLIVVVLPLKSGDTTVGTVQLSTSLALADHVLARLRLYLILGVLGAMAVGILLGVPLTRAALRPLEHVTTTSERIAAGNLGQRLDLPGGRDEIGRLATAFDRMVDRLEGALRSQRQFVADASHELRTPLTALGGLVEMLLLGVDQGDTRATQRALRSMHREIDRLTRLVNDLLTLSRFDAQQALDKRPADLAALVAEVGEQTRLFAGEREVTWRAASPLVLELDPDRLRQVLLNLTSNAVANTAPTGHVALRAWRGDSIARVAVSDDGAGIDPADLPHLFERFYRSDKARVRRAGQGSGSGLGLAIARVIIEAHGGAIDVESAPGRGTTFTLTLPAPPPARPTEQAALPAPAPADPAGRGSRRGVARP